MAFDLEPGDYELQMKYVPEGNRIGLGVSLAALAIFISLQVVGRRKRAGKKAEVSQ
jgi:hypothetical protein